MTVYATPGDPKDGATVPTSTAFAAFFAYASDGADNPSGDDYPMMAQERYRLVGAGTWTELAAQVPSSGGGYYTAYPTTLAAGNYERQVRAQSTVSAAWSAYSSSAFFTVSTAPAAPTLTAPTAGMAVNNSTTPVTWSAPTGTTGYEVQVRTGSGGGGSLEWSSGQVTSTSLSTTATFLVGTGVTRYVRVRVRKSGLWSTWSERQVTVTYQLPAVPTVVVAGADSGSLGMNHVLNVTATHPTPSGGQPTVTSMHVWVRRLGDTSDGIRVLADQTPTGTKTWRLPAGRGYEARVEAIASTGTRFSSWVAASPAPSVKGVLIHDPSDPAGTIKSFRLNDDGAEDEVTPESALVPVHGRTYPLLEYGVAESRIINVSVVHSKGSTDADALRALMRRRTTLCYRDAKGRKAYGRLEVGGTKDTFYGHVTSLTFTATDYAADPDVA